MNKKSRPWFYSFPALAVISLIILFPILYTGYLSFTNMNIYHWFNPGIIGFENYRKALFVFDSGFLPALLRTILWTVLNMAIQVAVSFLISVLLNSEGLVLKNFYKTLLMFPWAMPAYVSILLWRLGIFNSQFGLLNHWLSLLKIEPVNWLNGNLSAFLCCMVVNLWMAFPFMILTMDGAIQSIDKSYYESAVLEGAGTFTKMTKITYPMIRPIIMPAVILTTFVTFKQFDTVYLMTQQVGSKTGADIHTVITYAYEKAFITSNYGYSAAISILIFIIIIALTVISKKYIREGGAQ
ncbi:Maltose transport system permease protein MalF [Caprobacter fermentans]|uniref:Maltose transport system permease protein MalF n=1 Tax=Caproicibacter fermentans TaxID=2576756 RepID=A0A6N8I3S5_9FIRM|nr:sugar ABC transporter permease [Caproicibacter fermentans]MVB12724.1 Maltose transport system permease protein MalF [Caproicibacter fermentans]OCN02244.1 sugar ABC transporter permease [Clostridium sp. W14A]QNK39271.1 sugar ABC transporter permease [Caproicibacter fermentans]